MSSRILAPASKLGGRFQTIPVDVPLGLAFFAVAFLVGDGGLRLRT
jgi:hypothetical protein